MSRPSLVALGSTLDDLREAAKAADAAGFESVWAAEFFATETLPAVPGFTRTATAGAARLRL